MLTHLHIADLGIIDDASLELGPGLTVVTGETGAGKTLVVTGLGLLMGQRADAGLVRHGCAKALVEGRFSDVGQLVGQLREIRAELDEDGGEPELLVSRQVSVQGRARAWMGGLQVPLGSLAQVVDELATIHGQSEQVRLATSERQREVLDRAAGAGMAEVLAQYRRGFAERRAAQNEVAQLKSDALARAREADMLRFGLGEIAAVDPQAGEDDALAVEAHRLQDIDDLRALAADADQVLSGGADDDFAGAVSLVGQARKALETLSQRDSAAVEIAGMATSALDGVAGLAAEVASYLSGLEADPLRLEAVTARRAQLQALTRKYGANTVEVLAWASESANRLGQLQHSDERIGDLQARISQLDQILAEQASQISQLRAQAADSLSSAVHAELVALAMPHARLEFHLEPLAQLGPWGAETAQLQFSANAGAPPAPLAKVASGGELSRVRLALEVVLANTDQGGQTFVFDEVDAGVGGAVGLEIGRRLARLSRTAQVIVVTHLAQVAAWANHHFIVVKHEDGDLTTAGVHLVEGDQRVREIARMMGGLPDSQAGLEHAADLLAAANNA